MYNLKNIIHKWRNFDKYEENKRFVDNVGSDRIIILRNKFKRIIIKS